MRDFLREKAEPQQILGGWKEIANYLGKGVRTVQRYECEFALPVHRPAGRSRGSVVATKAELDAWVQASPVREAFNLTTRQKKAQNELPLTAIQNDIAQMRRLRDQMASLQSEVKASVALLRESIHSLQGEMDSRWSKYATSPHTKFLCLDSRTKDLVDLLPTGNRKAN